MAKKKPDPRQPTFESLRPRRTIPEAYYSGDKPNPNLRRFVEEHATAYDPEADDYSVPAFNRPIETTKATAIYNMHVYWSKKPHTAIRQYVRHYTRPGDIVLDPFCGSGGTALAALLEGRKAIASDRSPAATFITKNHCTPVDPDALREAFEQVKREVQPEIDWLYETRCDRCGGKATTGYTVYSQVFQCPRCLKKIALHDCGDDKAETAAGKVKAVRVCPSCQAKGHTEVIRSQDEKFGYVPVKVVYRCENGCKPAREVREHDDAAKKGEFFKRYDLGRVREIEAREIPHWYPRHKMMNVEDDSKPWGAEWREGRNFRTVAELFTKRNLWALAAIRAAISRVENDAVRDALMFGLTGITLNSSKMYKERESGRGISSGTYYVPQISREMVVTNGYDYKIETQLIPAFAELAGVDPCHACISTQSCTDLAAVPSNSIDYIFTDPPYAEKVQYGELNFVWEAWLDLDTTWHEEEIIVNEVRGKSAADWEALMKKAIAECFRVLKPGRWLSLCYHDTSEGTWTLVQDIMAEAGFVVDRSDSTLFIDTGQKSYNQINADKATKRDLVINFRKPKAGDWIVKRTADGRSFREIASQLLRDFLTKHPGSTKDRVYDHLVSRMVQSGKMEAHDFEALLRTVAEEASEGRWYLKETADHLDQAEQAKEDGAAARLQSFMAAFLKKHPEQDGIHYSDLFEQYLPLADKPRRLMADWLPECFIKTPSGTWRPPDKEEAEQLAKLREAGTLRRIKRFANALIEGVPVREKDRPGSDVDLLDWLRQCRRAGLYDQGRAIYETGGLNLANLTDEQQIEAEDDYRICARRGSDEVAKPRRERKMKQAYDE
ncbi:MAG: DNA methyltransferase [Isosphaeraceae bacterium]